MKNLISEVFSNPETINHFQLNDWDLLVRQARNSDLAGKLFVLLRDNSLLSETPKQALPHLTSAHVHTQRHGELVKYEIHQLYNELSELDTPIILLKGAAYVAANLPSAEGRFFSDIDIMVHKSRVAMAEDALQHKGWRGSDVDDYDEKYYRTWMHEIPPMQHSKRGTTLDLHHTIIPETARYRPDANKLFKAAIPVDGYENLYTLCPEDMVLHSATHLFSEGEFELSLRDLIDIDALLRLFPTQNQQFWQRLIGRARNLDLKQPLHYALRYCRELLNTPIPDQAYDEARNQAATEGPSQALTHFLLERGLRPNHSSCHSSLHGLWLWMLYVRSHYLRMPFKLLIPHLLHKALITPYEEHKRDREAAKHQDIHTLLALRNR